MPLYDLENAADRRRSVLIVESDPATRGWLTGYYRRSGCEVFAAATWTEARAVVALRHSDVIVGDVPDESKAPWPRPQIELETYWRSTLASVKRHEMILSCVVAAVDEEASIGMDHRARHEIARRVAVLAPRSLAHLAGDELELLLVGLEAADAAVLAERARNAVAGSPIMTGAGTVIQATASFGIAEWHARMTEHADISGLARTALAEARAEGGNRVVVASAAEVAVGDRVHR